MRGPLLVNGFVATGKSTVGELVARRAGVRFVELHADGGVGGQAGGAVSDVLEERRRLQQLLSAGEAVVVALGPETLLDRVIRLQAIEAGVVVSLRASAAELAERIRRRSLQQQPGEDGAARLRELLEDRASAYAEAHAVVDAGAADEETAARRALAAWQLDAVGVAAGLRSYVVEIGGDFAPARVQEAVAGASRVLLVSDGNVYPLHGSSVERAARQAGVQLDAVVLEPGERHKNLASLERIWKTALEAGADRSSIVLGLGGGVVTDVAGFAAACWMRGVRWAALPTTLLAMVDASVGGKTAVDLLTAKNAVGAFWQPSAVWCDVRYLQTEGLRGYRSALAEVVKTALIGDAQLLALLEDGVDAIARRERELVAEMVRRSVRVKASVVSRDEREGGLRACLNLGHTVGHALESQGGYQQLSHGEAVSLGLVLALRIGERLGRTPASLTKRTTRLLKALGLPVEAHPAALRQACHLLGHDKKRAGSRLRFVVAEAAGRVQIQQLDLEVLRNHVLELAEQLG